MKNIVDSILFDFDGVIADTVEIKTRAFYSIYEEYGTAIAEKAVEHHILNGGMSRFEKVKFYHKKFSRYRIKLKSN